MGTLLYLLSLSQSSRNFAMDVVRYDGVAVYDDAEALVVVVRNVITVRKPIGAAIVNGLEVVLLVGLLLVLLLMLQQFQICGWHD